MGAGKLSPKSAEICTQLQQDDLAVVRWPVEMAPSHLHGSHISTSLLFPKMGKRSNSMKSAATRLVNEASGTPATDSAAATQPMKRPLRWLTPSTFLQWGQK